MVGNIRVEAIHTPGHTPEHVSYLITDLGSGANEPIALATGDFLFVGDVGRPDLLETAAGVENVMEPSARTLCASLRDRLTSFSDFLQILPAHGAGSACGKSLGAVPTTTLGYERRFNSPFKLSVQDGDAFVKEILQGQPDPPLYFATMKRVNRDGAAVTNGLPSPAHCTNDDLEQSLADRSIKILDTRTNQESFNNKHITRSITAPLRSPFFSSAAGSFLAEQDKIFLVVEDPKDVELAVRQLYRIGFDNVVGWVTVREAQEHGSMNERTERVQFANFDADKALQQGAIVDVRATSEFQLSHIKGAYSLPYTRMRELLTALPKDKKLFVHCASGKRASLATSFLCARGYDAVLIDGKYSEHMPSCRISSSLPS